MILALASSVGAGNSIFLSRRPDLRRAGSRMSTRFVAAITLREAGVGRRFRFEGRRLLSQNTS